MVFLRIVSRSAPRLARAFGHNASFASHVTTSFIPALRLQSKTLATAFSTSGVRRAGETDADLAQKLASELEFESEAKDSEPVPTSIKDFLEEGPFKVIDVPGKEEVKLLRDFGDEKITVTFSIADLHGYDPTADQLGMEDDSALGDEDNDASTSKKSNPEADEDENFDDEIDEGPGSVRCGLGIVIEKPGKGALNIEAVVQDMQLSVENFYYFSDAKLAYDDSAEAAHKAQHDYTGPPFGSLDEDLQVLIERFLEERGIGEQMAIFVPDYMDMKEQKEYVSWLSNVKKFVEA